MAAMSLTQLALLTERKERVQEPRPASFWLNPCLIRVKECLRHSKQQPDALMSVSPPVKSSQLKTDMSLGLKNDWLQWSDLWCTVLLTVLERLHCLSTSSQQKNAMREKLMKILGYTFSYCNLLFGCTQWGLIHELMIFIMNGSKRSSH